MAVSKAQAGGFLHRLARPFINTVNFLREVWQELHRVVWPSHEETYTFTIVVLIAVVIVAIWVGALDMIFTKLVGLLHLYK